VGGALHQSLDEELRRPLVESTDLHHRRVETFELLAAELHGRPPKCVLRPRGGRTRQAPVGSARQAR
jgi:hypothetical protein